LTHASPDRKERGAAINAAASRWTVGSPLVLSRVHWVRPEVVEVSYVEMTPDGLLRHVSYLGEREDKPAREVFRSRPT
jgi:ATP-dependent DNA ligase